MAKVKVSAYKAPSYTRDSNPALTESCGKILAEYFKNKGHEGLLKEQFGNTLKEDVTTTTGSGAYTTLLSKTLYTAAISNIKDVLGLVNVNEDMMNGSGFGAYKIPLQEPTTAVEIAEGAIVNYFDEGATSVTVTPKKYIAGTAITWEIQKRGMTDFVKYVLQNAADGVARKLASEIVNGLATGASSANTKTGGISYTTITNAQEAVESATTSNNVPYGFLADKLVISSSYWANFLQDSDIKNMLYRVTAQPGMPVNLTVGPGNMMFGDMEVVRTQFLTGAQALVLDSRKAAMLVKESDLETFEGAIPGRPYDREVVALMSFVLAVLYPKAIAKITA